MTIRASCSTWSNGPTWAPLIYGALADDADAIIMASDREEGAARAAFDVAGFGFHRLLVWDKITGHAKPLVYAKL